MGCFLLGEIVRRRLAVYGGMMSVKRIKDSYGEVWCFDGKRVYLEAAEEEVGSDENGYPASSWGEALVLLVEYGYLGEVVS